MEKKHLHQAPAQGARVAEDPLLIRRTGEELGIISSPKASIEGTKPRAYIGEGSKSLFRDGKLEIILRPKASIEGESSE